MKRDIPGPLWIAIVALGIISLLTLVAMLKSGSLVLLAAAATNIALLAGLAMGHKWAYVLTVVLSVLGVVVTFGKSPSHGLAVMAGNSLVLIPVLISTRFFFPIQRHEEDP